VGLQNLPHAEVPAQLEEAFVLVGGVQKDRIAGLPAAQDIDVVVHGTDHDLVDLGPGILVEKGHLDRPV
jgi:hypothetical protein